MDAHPVLALRNISVSYKGRRFLDNVSFDLTPGRVLGIFGNSGSGKSTLLHSIFGITDGAFQVDGTVVFNGIDISNYTADQRSLLGMSIVLQRLALFEKRSVQYNVEYPLRLRGVTTPHARTAALRELARLGIAHLGEQLAITLSEGQRKRVALARALVYQPNLLLLDEPFSGLHDELRYDILAFIKSLHETRTTVLLVTHSKDELELAADEILTLTDGTADYELRTIGKHFQLLRDSFPIVSRVADFPEAHDAAADSLTGVLQLDGGEQVALLDVRPLSSGKTFLYVRYRDGRYGWVVRTH